MKKTLGMPSVVMVAVLLWGGRWVQAQQPTLEKRSSPVVERSVDGSGGVVLRSGAYRVLSLVGQPVAGTAGIRSGGIWVHHQRQAQQAAALRNAALEAPVAYALEANYPNPFNPETVIRFALPESGPVQLVVYDVLGREVARLVDEKLAAGRHEVVFAGGHLASGLYVYRMQAGSFEQHHTMLLVK